MSELEKGEIWAGILARLDKIQATLDRVEQRQIKTTAMVEDVKEHEAPVVGSFASTDQ